MRTYFFNRKKTKKCEAGYTISKKENLPEGNFIITEYNWPDARLWFVKKDRFTGNQREAAYRAYLSQISKLKKAGEP